MRISSRSRASPGAGWTRTPSRTAHRFVTDDELRTQLLLAVTEDDRLHGEEVQRLAALLGEEIKVDKLARDAVNDGPGFLRKMALSWSDKVLSA